MARTAKQMPLPFEPGWEKDKDLPLFDDPAFMDNRTAPVHRWVPWIAGFSGAFVDSVLTSYLNNTKNSGFVLDPFAGVGTTLVQAVVRGYRVVGFEINPYASLAANVKLSAIDLDPRKLEKTISQMRSDSRKWRVGEGDPTFAPIGFRSRVPFFSPKVETQVFQALEFISNITDNLIRDLLRVAFGAVMVSFSNYTYEPSLSTRRAAGKPWINEAGVAGALLEKLRQMQSDIRWLRAEAKGEKLNRRLVYNEDFFEGQRRLEDGSIRLMVTSPPYLNNYHYARNTRPQLYWLGLISSPKEQRPLEEKNFGTFWQIARTKDPVSLNFNHGELERILEQLRQLSPEKGEYGGLGWANYAASYFNDCERFMIAMKRCLRKDGTGVIVVGNSILQGINYMWGKPFLLVHVKADMDSERIPVMCSGAG